MTTSRHSATVTLEPVYACVTGDNDLFFVEGHIPRKAFIGALLSEADDHDFITAKIVKLEVIQGYRVDAEGGDGEWCEANWVWYFGRTVSEAENSARLDDKTVVGEPLAVTYADTEGCRW